MFSLRNSLFQLSYSFQENVVAFVIFSGHFILLPDLTQEETVRMEHGAKSDYYIPAVATATVNWQFHFSLWLPMHRFAQANAEVDLAEPTRTPPQNDLVWVCESLWKT